MFVLIERLDCGNINGNTAFGMRILLFSILGKLRWKEEINDRSMESMKKKIIIMRLKNCGNLFDFATLHPRKVKLVVP